MSRHAQPSATRSTAHRRLPAAPVAAAVLPLLLLPLAVVPAAAAPSSHAASGSSPATVASASDTVVSADGVEVTTYGTTTVTPDMNSDNGTVVQAVHAVQRVQDRTVVYWSVGSDDGFDATTFSMLGQRPLSLSLIEHIYSAPFVNLVLPDEGVLLYAVPVRRISSAFSAATTGAEALPEEEGELAVQYAVLPGLPEGVEEVDVLLGFAGVVPDVPVGEGLLTPALPVEDGPVLLGTGWPRVTPEDLAAPVPELFSVRPLSATTEQVDGFSRETESAEEVTIDIAADVLFAFDSADLSGEAVARLEEVAAEIAERAASGTVSVVGHTDSQGGEASNETLSVRRAQSVAGVLGPLLEGRGLDLAVDGRGQREPIADNATEQGRQLNRRVTVTFQEQDR
ncbi:OmpA family protein [Pseudokineococcus sp. 1T1Z-3]|uniref:OmpA family protein n=1 Tax=Pseudokineococcus sp. 1T1Z-3 TaxID=3132745 RepID=UPI0030AA9A19